MKVSECCFNDEELKHFICASSKEDGVCQYCVDKKEVKLIDIEVLKDFFSECLNLFVPNVNGHPLIEFLQNDLNLLASSSDVDSEKLLSDIISLVESEINTPNDLVDYNEDIIFNVNHWEVLKEDIRKERRYLINALELSEEYAWDTFFNRKYDLQLDKKMYRARIHEDSGKSGFLKEEMKCPSKEKSTNGRANPRGIPYLYLCKDKETTFYETRALYLDELSIGIFKVVEGERISLVDFTETPSLYSEVGNVENYVKSILLKKKISEDLSKPLRRYDSVLEYIPTQFICEYIREINGADGIIFKSSLHKGGKNMVLFNSDKVECIEVEKCCINKVEIGEEKN